MLEMLQKFDADDVVVFHQRGSLQRWQLARLVGDLSDRLRSLGIQQGDRVMLLLPNSPELLVAYYACLASGIIAVPVNHDTIVFQPMKRNGTRTSDNQLVISTGLLKFIFHAVDTNEDFTWLFSNRHLLPGEDFGSERHRDSIYAIFDADGMMGLSSEKAYSWDDPVIEGQMTRLVIEAMPTMESILQRAM